MHCMGAVYLGMLADCATLRLQCCAASWPLRRCNDCEVAHCLYTYHQLEQAVTLWGTCTRYPLMGHAWEHFPAGGERQRGVD